MNKCKKSINNYSSPDQTYAFRNIRLNVNHHTGYKTMDPNIACWLILRRIKVFLFKPNQIALFGAIHPNIIYQIDRDRIYKSDHVTEQIILHIVTRELPNFSKALLDIRTCSASFQKCYSPILLSWYLRPHFTCRSGNCTLLAADIDHTYLHKIRLSWNIPWCTTTGNVRFRSKWPLENKIILFRVFVISFLFQNNLCLMFTHPRIHRFLW